MYDNLPDKEMLISIWVHESQRVFSDRLVDEQDRDWFVQLIQEPLAKIFEFEWNKEHVNNILFGDYANQSKEYMRIDSYDSLPNKLKDSLAIYNSLNAKQMNLVFFKDAIMHLSRICRVLRQPRGNALLIGVGGSGRKSLTRMATSIRGYSAFSIEITKNYKDP
jgi:dynein heavy chain